MTTTIFCLLDPRTGQRVWIGETRLDLRECLAWLLKRSTLDDTPLNRWLWSLDDAGVRPVIEELEVVMPGKSAAARKAHWIAAGRETGWALLNASGNIESFLQSVLEEQKAERREARKNGKARTHDVDRSAATAARQMTAEDYWSSLSPRERKLKEKLNVREQRW